MFAFSFVIQVADIVRAGTAAWEDTGQECQVSQPPPRLIKPIKPPLLEKQRGRGQKIRLKRLSVCWLVPAEGVSRM